MLVFRGEKRYLAVDLTLELAEGDALTGDPTVAVFTMRDREPVELIVDDPAPPGYVDNDARFWVEVAEETEIGNYLILVTAETQNGEIIVEEAPLVVQ